MSEPRTEIGRPSRSENDCTCLSGKYGGSHATDCDLRRAERLAAIRAILADEAEAAVSSVNGELALLVEDGRKWQAAEAEGHIVTFTETGYGLMHPPSCRPDLIGCWHNQYLASLDYPDEEPGRYQMTRHEERAEYAALESETEHE